MSAGRIVLLNGTSSAGKSSLARALQAQLPDPWFVIDIDGFLSGRPTAHPGWQAPDVQRRLYAGFHAAIAAFADAGNDVIVATVVPWHDPAVMRALVGALSRFAALFVGVRCPLDVAEARERGRDTVVQGTVRSQFEQVHRYGPYDVEVDTSAADPADCAARVAEMIGRPDLWRAFARLDAALQ